MKTYTLSNGIKIVHQYMPEVAVSHCGLILKFGSRNEKENEHGIAHLIEHCLFKGTKKRKAYHILSRLDAVGGELNAYTTKEELCVYACFKVITSSYFVANSIALFKSDKAASLLLFN